jgi:hypothetical protein
MSVAAPARLTNYAKALISQAKPETAAPKAPVFADTYIHTVLRQRPLWRRETVEDYLLLGRDGLIVKLIEDGTLAWAWDITRGRNANRNALRILGYCAVERAYGAIKSIGPTADLTFAQVCDLVIPHHRETVKGTDLQKMLSCCPQHITGLHDAGDLKRVPERLARSGPNASPSYTRESVVNLLKSRRIL